MQTTSVSILTIQDSYHNYLVDRVLFLNSSQKRTFLQESNPKICYVFFGLYSWLILRIYLQYYVLVVPILV